MVDVKIGADPELWIVDKNTGKPISADGLFPGTKAVPHKVRHGAVQVDGMAAEFNIIPATNFNEFILHNLSVLRDLRDIIRAENPNLDFEFSFNPIAKFGKEYIDAQSEQAKELGCTPDFNAYEDGAPNPTPNAELPFRTSSGHIHIGWAEDMDVKDEEHLEACMMMVKQMDASVGMDHILWEGENGVIRRKLYGKAGAFRPKSYGVEYRTLSDVWLQSTVQMKAVFSKTKRAFDALINGDRIYEYGYPYSEARRWIDEGKVTDVAYNFGDKGYVSPANMVTVNSLDALIERYRFADVDKLLPPAPVDVNGPVEALHPALPKGKKVRLAEALADAGVQAIAQPENLWLPMDVAAEFDGNEALRAIDDDEF